MLRLFASYTKRVLFDNSPDSPITNASRIEMHISFYGKTWVYFIKDLLRILENGWQTLNFGLLKILPVKKSVIRVIRVIQRHFLKNRRVFDFYSVKTPFCEKRDLSSVSSKGNLRKNVGHHRCFLKRLLIPTVIRFLERPLMKISRIFAFYMKKCLFRKKKCHPKIIFIKIGLISTVFCIVFGLKNHKIVIQKH